MGGFLILIGGAEDRKEDKIILKKVLSLGKRIGVITSALSKDPSESYEHYVDAFREFDVNPIEIDIRTSSEADLDENLDILDGLDTIYFTGGDQVRLSKILIGTRFLDKLKTLIKDRQINYAGTSAGAAIVGTRTIFDGDYKPFVKGVVDNCEGFDFLKNIIVDTHFLKRARVPRLIQGLISTDTGMGIGIGEDTALFIKNKVCDVVGNGEVIVVKTTDDTTTNFSKVREDEKFSVENLNINYLFDGESFFI